MYHYPTADSCLDSMGHLVHAGFLSILAVKETLKYYKSLFSGKRVVITVV
jgi:hypothetical protein